MEGEEKGYVLGNYSKSSRWKGGRHLKAKGGLEVKLPKEQEMASEDIAAVR